MVSYLPELISVGGLTAIDAKIALQFPGFITSNALMRNRIFCLEYIV